MRTGRKGTGPGAGDIDTAATSGTLGGTEREGDTAARGEAARPHSPATAHPAPTPPDRPASKDQEIRVHKVRVVRWRTLPRHAPPSPMQETRRLSVEHPVEAPLAADDALAEEAPMLAPEESREGPIRPLPRRRLTSVRPGPPPNVRPFDLEYFHAGVLSTLKRCLIWVKVLLLFQLGALCDKLRRRDTIGRRAERLFTLFYMAGGSFIKIGQQLSVRVDLLPYEYCRELSKLLDAIPPFPHAQAVKIIERATGKPLGDTFLAFDPEPIGSASIACVYQAVLKDGRKVAVKVRRPGIGKIFAADVRAVGWLISFVEAFTIARPGYMKNFVQEFETSIREELDLRMEAYHQTNFRDEAKHYKLSKQRFFSAPRVHFELSSNEVLVQEFVSGMWMWEILAAVENDDRPALDRMRQLNIDLKVVAERICWIALWGQLISTIYHADPHPANIVVQKDSKIVFIDFGACGTMNKDKRKLAQQMVEAQASKDVSGAVRAALAFMEPVPPIDMNQLTKELEIALAATYQQIWSKHAPWYDKTSAAFYFKVFTLMRKFNIPANLDTVRGFRANMLYDTLALRLYHDLDILATGKKFLADCERAIRKKARRDLNKRLSEGLIRGSDLQTLDEVKELGSRGMQLARRYLNRPLFSFNFMIEKSVFTVIELVRLAHLLLIGAVLLGCGTALVWWYRGVEVVPSQVMKLILNSKLSYAGAAALSVVTLRRIMLRLSDQKV